MTTRHPHVQTTTDNLLEHVSKYFAEDRDYRVKRSTSPRGCFPSFQLVTLVESETDAMTDALNGVTHGRSRDIIAEWIGTPFRSGRALPFEFWSDEELLDAMHKLGEIRLEIASAIIEDTPPRIKFTMAVPPLAEHEQDHEAVAGYLQEMRWHSTDEDDVKLPNIDPIQE